MKPTNNTQNGMMMQEIKFLRQQVADLKKAAPVAAAMGPTATVVEVKPDLSARKALLELLVAAENYFGPEKDSKRPVPSKELRTAMEAAGKVVRKPIPQVKSATPEASVQ